jgi:hypothetical protein
MKGQEIVGKTAAELMDLLDAVDDDTGEIAEVMVAVRVQTHKASNGDISEEDQWSYVQWRASDPVWTHQLGLVHAVLEGMQHKRVAVQEEDDDDE